MTHANNPHPDRDRRVRQADRLARILSVLRLIQSRGNWNAKAIASELEVTVRTVYRDLQTLEIAGVPWFYDAEDQCYRVRSDYRFPVPNLTEEELIGQAVATVISRAIGFSVGGTAAPTTHKIAAASGEDARQLLADAEEVVCVLGLQLADHSRHQEIIRKVQQALIEKRRLAGTYSSPYQPEPVELRLNPIRLCLVKNAWYLIAKPTAEEKPKTYRIARFDRLELLDEPAIVPSNFDLKAYFGNAWAVYSGSETFNVRIKFLPDAARIVMETQWHATQEATPALDGSVVLSFRIDGLEEICNWILGWSGRAEVLEPQALRKIFADKLRAGLEMNR